MNINQAGIGRAQYGWANKETSEAEKEILGIQAWDRESLVMSEEEFNEQLEME